MVNEKSVVIKIRPDGKIAVRAEGFTGPACLEAVRKYAEALGVATSEEHLPEFFVWQTGEEDEGVTLGGEA